MYPITLRFSKLSLPVPMTSEFIYLWIIRLIKFIYRLVEIKLRALAEPEEMLLHELCKDGILNDILVTAKLVTQ